MRDFGKGYSYGKNSYQGLEASFNREMLSPESLRSLGFSSQDIPLLQSSDPSMLNQTTGTEFNGLQCDQLATSSAMVYINDQENMPLGQQASGITDDKAARKRQRDREYRERCKKGKMQMKDNLEALAGENEDLEEENESLQRENALMNQILESQEEEMKQLRNDLNYMKYEHEKQNMLVKTLSSEILTNPDLQLENQKLKDENVRLRMNAEMDDYSSQLIEENGNLQLENTVLRVQNDALCEKIANDVNRRNN